MDKSKFSNEQQYQFLDLYFKDEFELIDHLVSIFPWFRDLNEEASGLEKLDYVFNLASTEIESYVDKNLEKVVAIKSKPHIFEFKFNSDGSFEVTNYERGQPSTYKFKNRSDFIKFICWNYISMIPKYKNTWKRI